MGPCQLTKQCDLSTTRGPSPIVLKQLSKADDELRATSLMKLHNESASSQLQAYFEQLKKGSARWDVKTYIEGLKHLAHIVGPDRDIYYDEPLKGLHYPDSFAEQWNKTKPELAISVLDRDIRLQCPPSWSNLLKDGRHVLIYEGQAPLSQGLNELLRGPTTLDCGMWIHFANWMGIRNLFGDEVFDAHFKFKKGQFVLTQTWDEPMNDSNTMGNLLYPFFDHPLLHQKACDSSPEGRVRVRSVYNHESYLAKHPGGVSHLENVIQIDKDYIVFSPRPSQSILSKPQLEEKLVAAFNAPRDFADAERMWMYNMAPTYVHPDFAPKNWGILAQEAEEHANHTLDETDWKNGAIKREKRANRLHLVFNLQRLISCVEQARNGYSIENMDEDVLSRAEKMKATSVSEHLGSLIQQLGLSHSRGKKANFTSK